MILRTHGRCTKTGIPAGWSVLFPAILFTVTFLIGICYMTGWVSLVDTGQHWVQILFMCTGLTLLYIVGIADDLIGVRYRQKFIVQLIAAFMFPLAGLYINDFYGLFGIHAVSAFIGIPLTLVLVIFITNAINLIDGIDGLASGLSMVALSVFGTLAVIDDRWMSALLAFTTVGVLLPFFFIMYLEMRIEDGKSLWEIQEVLPWAIY